MIHLGPGNEPHAGGTHERGFRLRIGLPGANLEFMAFRRLEVDRHKVEGTVTVGAGDRYTDGLELLLVALQRGRSGAKTPVRRNIVVPRHGVQWRIGVMRALEAGLTDP